MKLIIRVFLFATHCSGSIWPESPATVDLSTEIVVGTPRIRSDSQETVDVRAGPSQETVDIEAGPARLRIEHNDGLEQGNGYFVQRRHGQMYVILEALSPFVILGTIRDHSPFLNRLLV
jgi:hypothetical protein